jgi:hypothetical protein
MPDGLRKLKEELAYAEAMAGTPPKKTKKKKKKNRRERRPIPSIPVQPPPLTRAGDCDFGLLDLALQAAVPIWIHRFKDTPLESVLNPKRLEELGDVIAEHGDVIMYRSTKKKGQTAEAFNGLAEALARLAHCRGGVIFNAVRYEAPARVGV